MRLALATCLLLAALVPAFAQGEARQYFKDWLAACRQDGYCSATGYQNPNPGNGTVADYILRVGRHAEGTYWEISFSTVATMAKADQPFDVAVDGLRAAREGLPLTFLEAGAYGCAILSAVDPDGFATRFGRHVPDDDFAAALHELMSDSPLTKGARAYQYIRDTYENEMALDAHCRVYAQYAG